MCASATDAADKQHDTTLVFFCKNTLGKTRIRQLERANNFRNLDVNLLGPRTLVADS